MRLCMAKHLRDPMSRTRRWNSPSSSQRLSRKLQEIKTDKAISFHNKLSRQKATLLFRPHRPWIESSALVSNLAHGLPRGLSQKFAALIKSAAFSAIAYAVAIVCAPGINGMTLQSTTLSPFVPYTLNSPSTTPPNALGIIAAVPT